MSTHKFDLRRAVRAWSPRLDGGGPKAPKETKYDVRAAIAVVRERGIADRYVSYGHRHGRR
jgi:hypothetical protein